MTIEQLVSEHRERMRNMTAYYRSLDSDMATGSSETKRRSLFSFHTPSVAQRIDGVNVLVPGQLLSAPFPNHIVLNTESGEVSWETSSQEWISEDGIYDHLVLKFPLG